MAFIAMKTDNPLGKRPYGVMLAGDFDFPGAPIPDRDPLLAGLAHKEALTPPAPVEVIPVSSPWTSEVGPVMNLAAIQPFMPATFHMTSLQTAVPTVDTTPQITAAVPGGTQVAQSWFAQQTLIPGLDNMAVVVFAGAIIGIGFFLARGH